MHEKFKQFSELAPQECFSAGGLHAQCGTTRFKVRHENKDYPVYKMKGDDGTFATVTWVERKITADDL